ncbi:hypothetical protein B0H15DRAFT_958471 [Mycena belliarum]|uniref:Uncharacterized protein n=1 Tax=Mycena belliarum TaxID=1033014 RepID=A0AAD6TN49_9AGAR|nr:hypothetical protein B0H15DRAFT_958471 [Mycena belliae]
MRATLRVLAARVHQPLIKFPGKRSWPSTTPHAHPAAPPELQKRFSDSVTALPPSAGKTKAGTVVPEYWEAPERFWRPRIRELENAEIEAVLSGGASLH